MDDFYKVFDYGGERYLGEEVDFSSADQIRETIEMLIVFLSGVEVKEVLRNYCVHNLTKLQQKLRRCDTFVESLMTNITREKDLQAKMRVLNASDVGIRISEFQTTVREQICRAMQADFAENEYQSRKTSKNSIRYHELNQERLLITSLKDDLFAHEGQELGCVAYRYMQAKAENERWFNKILNLLFRKKSNRTISADTFFGEINADCREFYNYLKNILAIKSIAEIYLRSECPDLVEKGKILVEVSRIFAERAQTIAVNLEASMNITQFHFDGFSGLAETMSRFFSSRQLNSLLSQIRVAEENAQIRQDAEEEVERCLSSVSEALETDQSSKVD
jgi:hypothetical protein